MLWCEVGEVWAGPPLKLTQKDLEEGFNLKGMWQFKGPDGKRYAIRVPGSWEASVYKRLRAYFGTGVYSLRLEIPKSMVGKHLQLHTSFVMGRVFRMYANGALVGHNGFEVGSTSRVAQYYPFRSRTTRLNLKIVVTNDVFHVSGLFHPVWIGSQQVMQRKRWKEQLSWHFILGIFVFLFLFHLLLYLFYRQDKIVLYFALVCLFVTLRVEFFGVQALEYWFGEIHMITNVKIARMGLYAITPALLWYIRALTHNYFSRWIPQAITYLALVFCGTVFLSSAVQALVFRLWFLVLVGSLLFCLYMMVRLWSRPESKFFVYSSLLFSVTVLNDVLHGLTIITTGFYGRFGFFLFCISQAGYIAWRYQQNQRASVQFAKELEETNQNLERIIDERTLEVREKNRQLSELMQYKEDSVKMLVHDLKSPLSTFMQVPEHTKESRGSLESASLRMQTLIESMLQVNESAEMTLSLQKASVHLNALSQKVVSAIRPVAFSRNVVITNHVPSTLKVEVDGMLVERVLQNVVENALKFAPEDSEVELRGSIQHGSCLLEILDEGPGMTPEIQAKAFEKYKSFGRGQKVSTGLGLFFCREVILAHGGDIRLVNRVTGGTNVQIQLPLSIENTDTLPSLSSSQRELLLPLVSELRSIEVFEISKLQTRIHSLKEFTDPDVERWTQALQVAIKEVDEASYQQLIHQVTADIDY